jgi:hypothetical protein
MKSELYEDNAGGLYIYRPGIRRFISGLQNVEGARYAEDAERLGEWWDDWVNTQDGGSYPGRPQGPEMDLIASFDGKRLTIGPDRAGLAGEEYLFGHRMEG